MYLTKGKKFKFIQETFRNICLFFLVKMNYLKIDFLSSNFKIVVQRYGAFLLKWGIKWYYINRVINK